ncbi:ribosome assembly factor SBDS [Ferroplasma sp.]|uniref:ribosome assembly factor SBDS n=1 Tax=Ferroplasma sp. TaxID=2591003 RepID=UPI00307D4B0B
MVSTDEAVIARFEYNGYRFEILVDPDAASRIRNGKIDLENDLALPEIFKDAKKGERTNEEILKHVFKTTDIAQIAIEIIKRGQIQLTTDQRREMLELKRKQVINELVREAINPQTNTPIPAIRIEEAMEEAKVRIDPFKGVDEQVQMVLKAIRPLIPIRMEKARLAVKLSGDAYGRLYGDIAKMGTILKEEWSNAGDYICVVEIPAGMQGDLMDLVNRKTNGEADIKLLK